MSSAGFKDGVFTGVKLYPANATTNSAAGVTDFRKIRRVLERMENIGMPLLIHAESVDPAVDIFDREAVFIERTFEPWTREFPGLRFIHEHLSSKIGCDFVRAKSGQVGGTITPYHLELNRTDWLGWGNRPYMYCMPVIKTEAGPPGAAQGSDRRRDLLLPRYRLGARIRSTRSWRWSARPDCSTRRLPSRPTPRSSTRRMRSTGSRASPRCMVRRITMPPNEGTITLERMSWTAPEEIEVPGPEERALIYRGGETIDWKVTQVT